MKDDFYERISTKIIPKMTFKEMTFKEITLTPAEKNIIKDVAKATDKQLIAFNKRVYDQDVRHELEQRGYDIK